MSGPRRPGAARTWLVHLLRAAMLAAIVGAIHWQHRQQAAERATASLDSIPLAVLQELYPQAQRLGDARPALRAREVVDANGQPLGHVLQTFPEAEGIIGFSGPTNVLVAFEPSGTIIGIRVLESGDTRDHVAQLRSSPQFLASLNGAAWEQAPSRSVDAVSGATLTSMAAIEGVLQRLGGSRPSLRFPDPPTLAGARRLFPEAAELQDTGSAILWDVVDRDAVPLGQLLRTGPAAEQVIGYQGPTDAWVGFGRDGKVLGVVLGRSYDNENYVDYVREDEYFRSLFNGMTVEQLAELDLNEAQIEGVSGATMTSMAVAESLRVAANATQTTPPERQSEPFWSRWSLADGAAMLVIVLGVLIATTHLRGRRWLRLAFRLLLIGYLGVMYGNLISQAMLVGWAQHGVPWRTAPSLVLLTAAALVLPLASGRNVYCTHLCPHGAVQQLLIRSPWRLHVPRKAARLLAPLPWLLLAWVLIVALGGLSFSLVDIEPFDAWLFPVAGWATLTIAVVGLLASLFSPMAYCRYGCPTGALLNYVRKHSQSGRWLARDWAALTLTAAAVGWTLLA